MKKANPTLIFALALLSAILLVSCERSSRKSTRELSQRHMCQHRIKRLSFAIVLYEDKHGTLPPLYTVDDSGRRLHSWRTLLLPFMNEQELYDSIDLTKPWDDPVNRKAFGTHVSVFQCPTIDDDTSTTFLALDLPGSSLRPSQGLKKSEITDDLSKTLLFVEAPRNLAVHWMSPHDLDENKLKEFFQAQEFPHSGTLHAATCDSNPFPVIRISSARLSPEMIRAMATIDQNDESHVEIDDFLIKGFEDR